MDPSTNATNLASDVTRKAALAEAWDRALLMMPPLALLQATGGSLNRAMAESIDQAIASGVLDHDKLVETALDRIPRLRSPNGHKQQLPSD